MAKTTRMRHTTGRRVRRRVVLRRVVLTWALLAMPLGWLLTAPAEAVPQQSAGSQTVTVADAAEAWYADSPIDICTTPLGCPPPPVPSSPYPANTLHVGVAGGRETARTYVLPDLLSLPFGATFTGGVMTLPVDTASTDGTASADTARMLGCLVSQPFPDGTAGASTAAPKADCSVSARAVYDAKKSVFTLDLSPFLKAWSSGKPSFGIALVPDSKKVSPTDAWHVTINGRKRAGETHVQSVITYTPPPPVTSGTGTGSNVSSTPPVTTPNPPAISVPNAPPLTATAPPPVIAPTQPTTPVAQQPVAYSRSFQYPLAFLAPLALLVGVVFFIRLFTRDPLPRRAATR